MGYRRPDPIKLVLRWFLRLIWRGLRYVWDETFHPIPDLKPGEHPTKLHRDMLYRSQAWQRLSYRVKKKHGWRCMCCGRTPPEVKIVTDHIKSLRYNWELRLDPSNMQVLCEPCNLGKGSRDSTDFRKLKRA